MRTVLSLNEEASPYPVLLFSRIGKLGDPGQLASWKEASSPEVRQHIYNRDIVFAKVQGMQFLSTNLAL